MKKVWILLIFIVSLFGCKTVGTPLSPEDLIQQKTYIIERPASEIYRLSMEWMVITFKSAEAVIEYEDKDEGVIMGKGAIAVTYETTIKALWEKQTFEKRNDTFFILKIEIKENGLRIGAFDPFRKVYIKGIPPIDVPITTKEHMAAFKEKIFPLFDDLASYIENTNLAW